MTGICPFLAAAARAKGDSNMETHCFPECEIFDEVKGTCSIKSTTIRLHYIIKAMSGIKV